MLVQPDQQNTCMYADGSAFYDTETGAWHYLCQVLNVGGVGGWQLSHFSRQGPTPFGAWVPNPRNPVVHNGQLFSRICAGADKHCKPGMGDEGTPEIVEKRGGEYYVTFHGYDYKRKQAARAVARTADFVVWNVTGGAEPLPGDAIFTAQDCQGWNVPWATATGCIGSGEASVIRTASGYLYEVIEAADVGLECVTAQDQQWWPLGMVRSRQWSASPRWQQMSVSPLVGGPGGHEPHVGCSIQYNSMHVDDSGETYLGFWDVAFYPANKSAPAQSWHLYKLVWGPNHLPMTWPGPAEALPNCSSAAMCKATCPGFVQCPSDSTFYCCADSVHCRGTHLCQGTPGLKGCACGG